MSKKSLAKNKNKHKAEYKTQKEQKKGKKTNHTPINHFHQHLPGYALDEYQPLSTPRQKKLSKGLVILTSLE